MIFPARLALLPQLRHGTRGCRRADLLLELTPRSVQGILGLVVLPLGDGPGPGVLPGPERAAHVGDEDFQPVLPAPPVHQQGRAPLGHSARPSARYSWLPCDSSSPGAA